MLSSIKRRATMANASSRTFTDAQLLTLADEEIAGNLLSLLTKYREEYGVFVQDVNVVAGKQRYRLPSRSWMGKLRDIKWVDESGKEWFLARLEPDMAINNQNDQAQYPTGYYIESNSLVLRPAPNASSGKLRMRYYIRPNNLVALSAVSTVASVVGQVVTVVSAPTTFTGVQRYDFLRSTPGFEHILIDLQPTTFTNVGAGSYELTFADGVDLTEIEVGDYCCLAEQTPAPQLPADMHPLLYQRVVCKVQELQGDASARAAAIQELQLFEQRLAAMVPRVESAKQIIQPYLRDWLIG